MGTVVTSVNVSCNGIINYPKYASTQVSITQSGEGGGGPGVVNVGTTEDTVSLGDITPGRIVLQNLDDTNYVEYGPATGSYLCRLLPGASAGVGGPPDTINLTTGATIYIKANTAACDVLIIAYDA